MADEIIDEQFDYIDRMEYITGAFYMLSAAGEFNAMTAEQQRQQSEIKQRCMAILNHFSKEMYDEIFQQ